MYVGLVRAKYDVMGQTSFRWCGAEVWRWVSAQVLSSSTDHGSKSRGPSQNTPRVVSKQDVSITKLTTFSGVFLISPLVTPLRPWKKNVHDTGYAWEKITLKRLQMYYASKIIS
ncbi:hypothetical protein AVEN_184473-1 [Araneus ventricosus]|uniref:Uncharacterized protein n=1 Tax=Araneus ventricosus TaxID=182803 RepID=A0A4Y2BH94_ARAVE|nr:hypothetical protein AVEN_184473-1 [Araneus ventricosus]